MAKKPEYTRFSIYSKMDSATGEYEIPSYNKDIRNIINNAVKSALPDGAYFKLGDKGINKTGRGRWDIYVHTEDKEALQKSLATIEEELIHKRGGNERYHITKDYAVENKKLVRELRKGEQGLDKESADSRSNKWLYIKAIALLTTIADITRRILSSVLDRATMVSQDMLKAHNLGMSYDAVRGYRYAEITHGLKEGTVTGAVADIQSKFGNITSLDEKALEALAVVMGGKIEEMATMGLGASNPEKVLASIIDTFNERANSGYNSVGQYVGEQQARRELYSYLLKVSPQIADIFATMQEEQHNINSLYRNQADTFENWKNAFPTKGGTTWAQNGQLKIVSEQWNAIQSILTQIKEGVAVKLADEVLTLLKRIGNSRLFMSESQKEELNIRNKNANKAELEAIDRTLSSVSDPDSLGVGERAYYDVLVEQREALKKELGKEVVDDITTLPATLQDRAEKKVRERKSFVSVNGWVHAEGVVPTDEELDMYASVYGDTPENRQAYAEYVAETKEANRKKAVKQDVKDLKKYKNKLKSDFKKQAKAVESSYKNTSETLSDADVNHLRFSWSNNSVPYNNLKTLYTLGELYGFQYDLSDEAYGQNEEERMYRFLEEALANGLVTKKGHKYTLSDSEFVLGRYAEYLSSKLTKENPYSDIDVAEIKDFSHWLYSQDEARILGYVEGKRADNAIAEMQTGNAIQAIDWLNDSVQAMEKLAELNKKYPSATFEYRGENIRTNGGENIYKVIVDVKENGKTVASQPVLDSEGGLGFQGVFGYSKAGGNIMVTGKPASY